MLFSQSDLRDSTFASTRVSNVGMNDKDSSSSSRLFILDSVANCFVHGDKDVVRGFMIAFSVVALEV